jgi:hypothetical protein
VNPPKAIASTTRNILPSVTSCNISKPASHSITGNAMAVTSRVPARSSFFPADGRKRFS